MAARGVEGSPGVRVPSVKRHPTENGIRAIAGLVGPPVSQKRQKRIWVRRAAGGLLRHLDVDPFAIHVEQLADPCNRPYFEVHDRPVLLTRMRSEVRGALRM